MNGYLVAAYGVILVLIFGYLTLLHGRLNRLFKEISQLREEQREPEPPAG